MRRDRTVPGLRVVKTTFFVLLCGVLAGCATNAPRAISAPRDLAGTRLEFADLHSANTYEFLAGGRYRFAAVSQNGLRTDTREGVFVLNRTGWSVRIVFDNESVMYLNFDNADSGTCKLVGDARTYQFRLVGF